MKIMTPQEVNDAIRLTKSSLHKWRKKWVSDGCPHWDGKRMYYVGLTLDHFLDLLNIYKSKKPFESMEGTELPTITIQLPE